MARKPDPVQEGLARVQAVRAAPESDEARRVLGEALASKSSFVAGAAAAVVAEHELDGYGPALVAAFPRFESAAKDPGCKAKSGIIEALVRTGAGAADVFLRAVRIRQMEAAFGPPVDTAVTVRTGAAVGLAQMGHPDAAVEAALLLADKEWDARAGAARALGLVLPDASEPVLRFKLAVGDEEPAVTGECLRSLLAVAPRSLPVVAELLAHEDEALAEQAAFAMGDSRFDGAFEALVAHVENEPAAGRRKAALAAIGMLRRDAAVDWLIGRIADGDAGTAAGAIEALAIYRHDPRVADRVRAAAGGRRERAVSEALGRFGAP